MYSLSLCRPTSSIRLFTKAPSVWIETACKFYIIELVLKSYLFITEGYADAFAAVGYELLVMRLLDQGHHIHQVLGCGGIAGHSEVQPQATCQTPHSQFEVERCRCLLSCRRGVFEFIKCEP